MKSLSRNEIVATLAIVIFAFLTLNPFGMLMSSMLQMTVYGLLLVAVVVFAGLVVKEKTLDEREEKNRASAGRVGYVLGLVVLVAGVSVQTLSHVSLDPWIIGALVVMVLGKVFTRAYFEDKQ
jgi:amino acid transporter